ncbi:hypothetical protein BDY24DRAFT_156890 [Mrakia frigida]|uniref:uncharacterized protein n=1 Tax=Mrakia frigida TaxID=29902 RepID=UPI003FCBFF01
MESPLTPILNNLKYLYPSPRINQAWLSSCLTALLKENPLLSRQQQIKLCHEQLLLSDLSSSTLPSGFPPQLVGNPEDPMREGTIFEGTRSGCLVMVVSITEIGSSAFNLQRILHDRQEARSGVAKIRRLVGEEVEEEDEEGDEGPKYPREMLKLELSDGFSTVNILLQNVPIRHGVLLLSPETAIVKSPSCVPEQRPLFFTDTSLHHRQLLLLPFDNHLLSILLHHLPRPSQTSTTTKSLSTSTRSTRNLLSPNLTSLLTLSIKTNLFHPSRSSTTPSRRKRTSWSKTLGISRWTSISIPSRRKTESTTTRGQPRRRTGWTTFSELEEVTTRNRRIGLGRRRRRCRSTTSRRKLKSRSRSRRSKEERRFR